MKKTELKVWITKDALQKNKLNHGDMYDYSNISLLVLDNKLGRVVKSIQGREVVKATLTVEEELTELDKLKKDLDKAIKALEYYSNLDNLADMTVRDEPINLDANQVAKDTLRDIRK